MREKIECNADIWMWKKCPWTRKFWAFPVCRSCSTWNKFFYTLWNDLKYKKSRNLTDRKISTSNFELLPFFFSSSSFHLPFYLPSSWWPTRAKHGLPLSVKHPSGYNNISFSWDASSLGKWSLDFKKLPFSLFYSVEEKIQPYTMIYYCKLLSSECLWNSDYF